MPTKTKRELRQHFIRLRSRDDGTWLVHPDLKSKIVADAVDQGSNMTEVCQAILAEAYGVPFEPSGRKAVASPDGYEFRIYLPADLSRKIATASIRRYGRPRPVEEIRFALHAHYGLRPPGPIVRPRARRRTRA